MMERASNHAIKILSNLSDNNAYNCVMYALDLHNDLRYIDLVEELPRHIHADSFALPGNVDCMIGHNVDFDWEVIGKPEVKRICTLALARKIWPNLDSHNQSAIMYHLPSHYLKL